MKKRSYKNINLIKSLFQCVLDKNGFMSPKIVRFVKSFVLKKACFVAKFLNKNSTPPPPPEFTKTQVF